VSHYSPIYRDAAGHLSARPEYYSMLAFALAGHGALIRTDLPQGGDQALHAYGVNSGPGSIWVVLIERSLVHGARVNVTLPSGYSAARIFWLRAPSPEARDHITFGGHGVSSDGTWAWPTGENGLIMDGKMELAMSAASAAVIGLTRSGKP